MSIPSCPHAASGCNYPEGECAGLCYTQCHRCPVQSTCSGPMQKVTDHYHGGFLVGGKLVSKDVTWTCPTQSGR
jgi:hypothetical protein